MATLNIKFSKASACPTCKDYIYKLPIAVDLTLAESFASLGPLLYPLDKFKVVMIQTDSIVLDTGIGRSDIRVKFLKDQIAMSALFKSTLSKWLTDLGHEVTIG